MIHKICDLKESYNNPIFRHSTLYSYLLFYNGVTAPSGPRPPHYRGFMITFGHSTVGRTPLDELSVRRRELYLTTHNTHETGIHAPTGFEPIIPAS